ncbi:hypothetical protein Kpol_1010p72 [Vanderwaltozyma polyspora DSM 70294]|uniref:Mediator complex subunit 2 n=1 Tax=Vanderwaltozyma polyspora (strain ATCC 22028 / DSM 70294 / BCRC 21397 / CBS 2163 / NBRC 10782 / NRRL Y-8283 / UCD 57-17) TaxID=436907 RepID=A7TIL6_VANPO|nr:uncharacterized protein Kpol_1010p72 [Vanderwaltozyma polyspora DSM 70294]EDO17954.1 hypothetical protein Kpol_1010p72 [Vanderwaltozyma polyspora DSM 70294]
MATKSINLGGGTGGKNKLVECFEDILEVSSQMLVQQQLKSIQLDNSVISGFNQGQQKVLLEKVTLFHSILDDLEITLNKGKNYVDELTKIGKDKEEERERVRRAEEEKKRLLEEEEKKRLLEEEEKKRLQLEKEKREEEELKKKKKLEEEQELELEKLKEQQQQQQAEKDKSNEENNSNNLTSPTFFLDTPTDLVTDITGSNKSAQTPQQVESNLVTAATSASLDNQSPNLNKLDSSSNKDKQVNNDQQSENNNQTLTTSAFDDPNSLDISMFPGLDGGAFDLGSFGASDMNSLSNNLSTGSNNANNDSNNLSLLASNENQSSTNNNSDTNNNNNNNNESSVPVNTDDYLTLNDFNDLNIDWNTTGDPGDLDLNGFNL